MAFTRLREKVEQVKEFQTQPVSAFAKEVKAMDCSLKGKSRQHQTLLSSSLWDFGEFSYKWSFLVAQYSFLSIDILRFCDAGRRSWLGRHEQDEQGVQPS